MATRKFKRKIAESGKDKQYGSRQKINTLIEEIITHAAEIQQLDSYYEAKVAELKAIDEKAFTHISRRFLKGNLREKEIILHFLKFWTGIEHIAFLQEYLVKEIFLPRMGIAILDLFNKCDAMLEAGMASRLLELESLTRRLKQHIIHYDALDDCSAKKTVADFIQRDEREKVGILCQLINETGKEITPLLLKIIEIEPKWVQKTSEILELMQDENLLEILRQIYESTKNKDTLKIIKKNIHALRQKGVQISDYQLDEPTEAVFKKISLPNARAFISSVDGIGDRIIFMAKPITAYENRLFEIYLNDVTGVKEINSMAVAKKETDRFMEKLTSDEKIMFCETTPENACFLIEEAYRLNQQTGTVISGSIAQWKSTFSENINMQKEPMIYQQLDSAKIKEQYFLLNRAEKLLSRLEIIVWFIETAEARDHWMKYNQAKNSPLILSQYQVEERLHEQCRETATAFFNHDRRQLFKRRLEELSYILMTQGSEEDARIAFVAALSMTEESLPPEKNYFCIELIKKGYKFFETNTRIKGNQDSVIIDPKDVSLFA